MLPIENKYCQIYITCDKYLFSNTNLCLYIICGGCILSAAGAAVGGGGREEGDGRVADQDVNEELVR